MNARTLRRAQERKASKLTRPQAPQPSLLDPNSAAGSLPNHEYAHPTLGGPNPEPLASIDVLENPATPGHATGPRSPEGKAVSSLNALKSGLTGRTVLLPSDDAAAYLQQLEGLIAEFQPLGPREAALVQSIADVFWRLDRIPRLELAIFAKGREEFASLVADRDPSLQPGLIEVHTFLVYEKQLRNLHLQESRLRRNRDKDIAELRKLQGERIAQEREDLEFAARLYIAAKQARKPFHPSDAGFDFSIEDLEAFIAGANLAKIAGPGSKAAA